MIKINYDISATSIVITCPDCKYWFAFRFDRIEAYLSGENHLVNVHDVPREVADNARVKYLRRRARRADHSSSGTGNPDSDPHGMVRRAEARI